MHITRYPARPLQAQIASADWESALDAWIRCLRHVFMASEAVFQCLLADPASAQLYTFLQDYLEAHTPRQKTEWISERESTAQDELEKSVFFLLHRIFVSAQPCKTIFDIPWVLFDFCALFAFQSVAAVRTAFENVSQKAEKEVFLQARNVKEYFQVWIQSLVSASDEMLLQDSEMHAMFLQSLTLFIRFCFPATCVFLEDEIFLASIISIYHRDAAAEMKSDLLRLVDTLFTAFLLRSQACTLIIKGFTWLYEQLSLETAFLRDFVLGTSIVQRFCEMELFSDEILSQLRIWKQKHERENVEKVSDSCLDVSVCRLSLISHIKDLFPEYGEGFIEACLKEFDDNVETVISHILEDSFPPHLRMLDKKVTRLNGEELSKVTPVTVSNKTHHVNDLLDFSKIYKGKKSFQTADVMLQDRSFIHEHKQTILDLVRLNQDDEWDDTYDDDICESSNLESQNEGDSRKLMTNMDELLYATYLVSPEVFNRTSQVRRSPGRIELRSKTGLSDEQIEGWKIMLDRNPHQLEKFENIFRVTDEPTLVSTDRSDDRIEFNKNFQKSQFFKKRHKKNVNKGAKVELDTEIPSEKYRSKKDFTSNG